MRLMLARTAGRRRLELGKLRGGRWRRGDVRLMVRLARVRTRARRYAKLRKL
jgi:hypothetical protein